MSPDLIVPGGVCNLRVIIYLELIILPQLYHCSFFQNCNNCIVVWTNTTLRLRLPQIIYTRCCKEKSPFRSQCWPSKFIRLDFSMCLLFLLKWKMTVTNSCYNDYVAYLRFICSLIKGVRLFGKVQMELVSFVSKFPIMYITVRKPGHRMSWKKSKFDQKGIRMCLR